VLVRDVVADYSEPSLASALPPIRGAESIVRDVLDGWPGSVRCSATSTAPRSRHTMVNSTVLGSG
jgi:hypothetical protein